MMLSPCSPLEFETPLYQGCGATELFILTAIVSFLCLPISLALAMLSVDGIHVLFFGFAFQTTGTLLIVSTTATVYRKVKYGKPQGWLIRTAACQIHPILSTRLIYKSGFWRTAREFNS